MRVNKFFVGIVCALAVGISLFAATDFDSTSTNAVSDVVATTNSPDAELEQIMEADDAAMDEVDKWIQENNAFAAQGAGQPDAELNKKIRARLDEIRNRYKDFLQRYPTNADAHLAYGTFLNDIGEEDASVPELETARKLCPTNPAAWNDLANYYGEHGPITNAFVYYTKAIELDSNEPVYYRNFATTVYLFRKDAREFYGIGEQQVFDKALALYQKAMQLDPTNFDLATDFAESYYGIKPLRTNDALIAWTNALKVAGNEIEREGVYIHLARIKMSIGHYAEAHAHLDAVTNSFYDKLKTRLEKNLAERENPSTNSISASTNDAATSTNTVPQQ